MHKPFNKFLSEIRLFIYFQCNSDSGCKYHFEPSSTLQKRHRSRDRTKSYTAIKSSLAILTLSGVSTHPFFQHKLESNYCVYPNAVCVWELCFYIKTESNTILQLSVHWNINFAECSPICSFKNGIPFKCHKLKDP